MRLARISVTVSCGLMLSAGGVAVPQSVSAAVVPCSQGRVVLTFDDGPSALTPRFVTLLRDRRVPAVFFVVGAQVRARPAVTRRAAALGFTIGNHTYRHENLTRLSDDGIRRTLRRTRRAIVDAGARVSPLMRPPGGSIDQRVRNVVGSMGLVPVLWTADPRDWDGRSASAIVSSTLGQLRPKQRNVVLLHDGVRNSGQTLRALPGIIRGARARGYCFVGMSSTGAPGSVVPEVRVSDTSVSERPGGSALRATVTLDRSSPRATSVRVRTVPVTATAGRDYVAVDQRLRFPAGVTRRVVRIRVRDDLRDERAERLRVRLTQARGLRIKDAVGICVIHDDDPPPRLTVRDTQVVEPATGTVGVPVEIRLSGPSEKWVRVTVSTRARSADPTDYVTRTRRVAFAPRQVVARFTVTVNADADLEGPEQFAVRASDGSNVTLADPIGLVTILPPG